jgi:uncharacterized lipoprotein YddW (UPF0748 family)
MKELIVFGDEAYTPEEWAYRQRKRERDRSRYRNNPKRREQIKAAVARWRERNPEYVRNLMRRVRAVKPHVVGSLHSLACTGPTIPTGCVCRKQGTSKITVWDKPPRQSS